MPFDDVPHRYRTLDSIDQQAFDWTQPDQPVSRSLMRIVYLFAALVLSAVIAAWFYATPAHAIPGSTQNPDGSWTGPNGEDLGGGNPKPDRPQSPSRDGEPTTRINCGCGYMVILRGDQTRAQGLEACRATVQAQRCSWVDGVYPGDKG